MANTKKSTKATVKGYNEKELKQAAADYISRKADHRATMKRFLVTPKATLAKVFHIVPGSWYECIKADVNRITTRNGAHKSRDRFSLVLKD